MVMNRTAQRSVPFHCIGSIEKQEWKECAWLAALGIAGQPRSRGRRPGGQAAEGGWGSGAGLMASTAGGAQCEPDEGGPEREPLGSVLCLSPKDRKPGCDHRVALCSVKWHVLS